MSTRNFTLAIPVFLTYVVIVVPFPPQPIPQEYTTYSVKDIIQTGIIRATAKLIRDHGLVDDTGQGLSAIYHKYFGQDQDSQEDFLNTIKEIVGHANDLQESHAATAYFHVNAEQFQMAHNYIRTRRNTIQTLASSSEPSLSLLRKAIGQALYPLIVFYSNSNWCEITGKKPYLDFGRNNVTLMEVADLTEDTCESCSYDEASIKTGSCENTLLTTKLTSGYRSQQDVAKPIVVSVGNTKAKCSHGTSDDHSKDMPATGGLYKGINNPAEAPQYHLHRTAFSAAIAAVEGFLIDGNTGILNDMDINLFRETFHIISKADRTKTSMTFVIDVSGSMWDDIQAVTQAAINIVTSTSVFSRPADYVLVTFNDPDSLKTIDVTEDGDEMVQWLSLLTIRSNHDCPEYSISGLISGIEYSRNSSVIYLFTDADAKDNSNGSYALQFALEKNITVNFMLTGTCWIFGRKRRSSDEFGLGTLDRIRRQTIISSAYSTISTGTGGSVFLTPVSSLDIILLTQLQAEYPSAVVKIDYFIQSVAEGNTMTLSVDNEIVLMKIEVSGASIESEVDVKFPNGTIVVYGTGKASRIMKTTGEVVISVQGPSPGKWTLHRHNNAEWTVNVTGESNFDFAATLFEENSRGFAYRIQGNPIYGGQYSLRLDLYNSESVTVQEISLTDNVGNDVTTLASMYAITIENRTTLITTVNITDESVGVKLRGLDDMGYNFSRLVDMDLKPVNVGLKLSSTTGELVLNVETNVSYTLRNKGDDNVTLSVSISDDKGYLTSALSKEYFLTIGGELVDYLQLTGTTPGDIVTYEVSVTLKGSSDVLQNQKRETTVSAVRRPTCTIISMLGSCPNDSLTTSVCDTYEWNGTALIEFSGVVLDDIKSFNGGSSVSLSYDPSYMSSGPVQVNISADCCSPSVYVIASDMDGYFTTPSCHFEFARTSDIVIVPTTEEDSDITKEAVIAAWVVATGVVTTIIVLIIVITSARIYIKGKQPTVEPTLFEKKEDDLFTPLPEKCPQVAPTNTHFKDDNDIDVFVLKS